MKHQKKFNHQRKEDLERIISIEGCELRMNRSIQTEGSFAELKQDMRFRRFLCRGKENVLAEGLTYGQFIYKYLLYANLIRI